MSSASGCGRCGPGPPHVPRLGLDLQGGTQVILVPNQAEGSSDITDEQLQQTVEIIRQRVSGFGVAEADVAIQGSGNDAAIVVSVPGVNQREIAEQLSQTALLDFRPVSTIVDPAIIDPAAAQQQDPTNNTNNTKKKKEEQQRRQRREQFRRTTPVLPLSQADLARPGLQRRTRNALLPPVEGDNANDLALEELSAEPRLHGPASRQGGKARQPR